MKNYLFLLVLSSMLLTCGKKYTDVPGHLIQPTQFTDLLTDIRLAEANQKYLHQQGHRPENLLDSSYHSIYLLHGVTEESVMESYEFYVLHPEWMDKITINVIDKLNHMER